MILGVVALPGRKDDLAVSLEQSLNAALKIDSAPAVIKSILSLYGLDNPSTMDSDAKKLAVLHFLNDICFAQGTRATAQAFSAAHDEHGTTASLCHFNAPNPWPGAWAGHGATHALDAAFALQNFNAYLSAGQRACAERMAKDVIAFTNGGEKQPFPPFGGDAGVEMVYFADAEGDADKSVAVSAVEAGKTGRRAALEALVGGKPEYLDQLMDTLGLVLRGPQ